ncbi:MAG: hypothetical protein AAB110_04410, partial [Candidatus Desantisbacteria bacterium]
GAFSGAFTVDTQTYGTCAISANGNGGAYAALEFVILSSVYSVSPSEGSVGTVVNISGNGYAANDVVTVSFGTNAGIQTTVANQHGSWTTSFTVDVQSYGTTTITAIGATTNGVSVATNVFSIRSQVVSVQPANGTVGTVVTVAGTGYAAGDGITVAFGTNSNIRQTVASQCGSFTTTFTVDVQPAGTTTIKASGVSSSAVNIFRIQPAVVSVLPSAGTVGTIVTVAGSGYAESDAITLAFGANSSIKQAGASQYGSFTTSFTVDTQGYGTTTIKASGVATNGAGVATNVFNILPAVVSVLPTQGSVGTKVTINSTGYASGETVKIAFGTNASIQQAVAGQYGSWTTSWTVDVQAYGTTTITAIGVSIATNVFSIQPQVVIVVPTAGTVGTVVTIAGTGYGMSDVVTIAFGTNSIIKQAGASQYGSFTCSWTVDVQAYGTTTITAISATAGAATNVFNIQPQVVSVMPTVGTVGTVVTIAGTGYGASDVVIIAFGTNSQIKQAGASQYGSFTCSWTVDVQRYGTTTIRATGVSSAVNIFRIQPQVVSVIPTAGTVGTVVTIAGTGYASDDVVIIAFGTNSQIKQADASQYGSFTCSFTVDIQPA